MQTKMNYYRFKPEYWQTKIHYDNKYVVKRLDKKYHAVVQ